MKGIGCSCREDAEGIIWHLRGWSVGRFENWGVVLQGDTDFFFFFKDKEQQLAKSTLAKTLKGIISF